MHRGVALLLVAFVACVCCADTSDQAVKQPQLDARIFDGQRASIKQFPYLVSVRHRNIHTCGGSILSANIVLTAAHCFEKPLLSGDYSIQHGLTSISGSTKNVIEASLVLRHRNFNEKTRDNNVALIYLVRDIPFGYSAQPIELASEGLATGEHAFISGWGARKANSENSHGLRFAEVTIIKNSICLKQYAKDERFESDGMLCAGLYDAASRDAACGADAGGPLVANGRLYGVIASGVGCGQRDDFYGLYASVAKLRSWIELYSNLYN